MHQNKKCALSYNVLFGKQPQLELNSLSPANMLQGWILDLCNESNDLKGPTPPADS